MCNDAVNSFSQQARYEINVLLIFGSICWVSSIFLRRREYMEYQYQASWQQAKMYTTNWKEVIWQQVELPYSRPLGWPLLEKQELSSPKDANQIDGNLQWNSASVKFFFLLKRCYHLSTLMGSFLMQHVVTPTSLVLLIIVWFLKCGFWEQPNLGYYSYRPQNSMFLVHLWKHLGEWQYGWK